MSSGAKKLIKSITRAVNRAKIDPRDAVEAMLACAAGLAVKAQTHDCSGFHNTAHDMYHSAEGSGIRSPVKIVKEPSLAN